MFEKLISEQEYYSFIQNNLHHRLTQLSRVLNFIQLNWAIYWAFFRVIRFISIVATATIAFCYRDFRWTAWMTYYINYYDVDVEKLFVSMALTCICKMISKNMNVELCFFFGTDFEAFSKKKTKFTMFAYLFSR